MAGSTRLELATSGVTGRRSNQLNYDPESNADWRMMNADWRLRRLSLRRIGIQRFPFSRAAGLPAQRASPAPGLPAVAREASEGWWAVQDSNL